MYIIVDSVHNKFFTVIINFTRMVKGVISVKRKMTVDVFKDYYIDKIDLNIFLVLIALIW